MIVIGAEGTTLQTRKAHRSAWLAVAALAFGFLPPVAAQDELSDEDSGPLIVPETGQIAARQVYVAAEFSRFAPRNALDMLRRVPGFVIREADDTRGLGAASGNVLLDGERLSVKSNDVVTQLTRIPSTNVVRIEVLDGATLDIPGLSGQVANIVTEAGRLQGQFSYEPQFRLHYTDPRFTRGSVSVTGEAGPIGYTIGLENQSSRSGAGGGTVILSGDREPIEFRDDVWSTRAESPQISARFTLDGPGDAVGNLNLSYGRFYYDFVEYGDRVQPDGVNRDRDVVFEQNGYDYEAGGDYAFGLGPGRLKLIGLYRFSNEPFRQTIFTLLADGSSLLGDRFTNTADSTEAIARAEYGWKAAGADWQISAEGAYNELENVSALFVLDEDGEFAEVPYPQGTGLVEENRAEALLSYGRKLSPKVALQLTLGGEVSELSQVGNEGLTRTFYRPKGAVSVAWNASPVLDLSFRAERTVGQLDFGDFLAQVNLDADRENAGNPDLVPEQSWDVEVQAERKLGPWGSTTLRGYGRLIEDIVDFVPIGEAGESPGNLDSAIVLGAEWASTLQFEPIGFDGARLDTLVIAQHSDVDDPLTGEPRPISDERQHLIEVEFRHDVPKTDWAWGGSIFYERLAKSYRLTEVGRLYEGPVWLGVFVEHKNVYGLTITASADNLLDARSRWNRTVYDGRRGDPIDFIEERDRLIGPIFTISINGSF